MQLRMRNLFPQMISQRTRKLNIYSKQLTVKKVVFMIQNWQNIFNMMNRELRECLWSLFLNEIEEDARYMTYKRHSYLGHLSYSDLLSFKWSNVIEEMHVNQSRLLDVFVTVATGQNKQNNEKQFTQNRQKKLASYMES